MSIHAIPGPDNITRTQLDNGITVLVYENHAAQSVVLSGSLPTGSLLEDPAQNGVASLTANALMRGTHNRDFETIYGSLENIGADLDFSARIHKTGFGGKALAEDLPTLVDVLADALRNPAFPEQQVEQLYPASHPYHYSIFGTLKTLPGIRIADMQAFHKQYYGPAGMIIVIVGAVEARHAVETVRAHLGDWENPDQATPPALPDLSPLDKPYQTFATVNGKSQADIVLGVTGPSRFAEDFVAASLANSVLGQFGMMGRIGHTIREQLGLAYYAYSRLEGGYGPGAWHIIAGVNANNVDVTITRIQEQIQEMLAEPVSDEDLDDNQSYYTGRLPLQLESNEGIAGRILGMESYDLGLDYLVNYHDMIYSVHKDDLLAAMRHYWDPDALVIAVAGPDETP